MRKTTESRIYLTAFALIGLITLVECSYGYGRTAEVMRRDNEQYGMIDAAIVKRDYWKDKYDSLADESDAVTIIAAEEKLQQEARK